jgi:hypothetical protein
MKLFRNAICVSLLSLLATYAVAESVDAAAQMSAADKALIVVPVTSPPVLRLPPRLPYFLPGSFAFRTSKGEYVTAINGGGRSADPTLITEATTAGTWEQFRIQVANPAPPNDKSFQTATGNYVTAVNGGGMTSDALHTDAVQVSAWEQFGMLDLSGSGAPARYALETIGNKFVTAVGGGAQYQGAFHTDATQVGSWEQFKPVKCGDIGSGYQYYLLSADGDLVTADDGGGQTVDAIEPGTASGEPTDFSWSKLTFLQQTDGTYALQTATGNYVTALGAGGQVQSYVPCPFQWWGACLAGFTDIFHTDATQVGSWEKFRIIDQGNCKYAIQTMSGYYFGIYQDSNGYTLYTTDRSVITDNEQFELVMSTLASPAILH